MQLLTKEMEARLLKAGAVGKKNKDGELLCQAKFFDPCGSYTFLAYGAEKSEEYGLILWGYAYMFSDVGWEHGTVGLNQLQGVRGRFGLGIERERFDSDGKHTIRELMAC